MESHDLTDPLRTLLSQYRRPFQYLLGVRANELMGADTGLSSINTPALAEGGIFVNGKPIMIGRETIVDLTAKDDLMTREESVTARAITSLTKDFLDHGPDMFEGLPRPAHYPLTALFADS